MEKLYKWWCGLCQEWTGTWYPPEDCPDVDECETCGRMCQRWEGPKKNDATSQRHFGMNEDHIWSEGGMFNPHAVPPPGSPLREQLKREGKIVERNGDEVLYSKNKRDYIDNLRRMGVENVHGEGKLDKERQGGYNGES